MLSSVMWRYLSAAERDRIVGMCLQREIAEPLADVGTGQQG